MRSDVIDLQDFVFVHPAELSNSPDGFVQCLKDRWWAVDAEGRIAFYNPTMRRPGRLGRVGRITGSPQCNSSEVIVRRMVGRYSWAVDVVRIPLVFRSVDPSDYV